jgi:hypothetical protein
MASGQTTTTKYWFAYRIIFDSWLGYHVISLTDDTVFERTAVAFHPIGAAPGQRASVVRA